MVPQSKKRMFEKNKDEYTKRTLFSIIRSVKHAKNIFPGGSMVLSKRSEMYLPNYWPLTLCAFGISGIAYFRGCRRNVEGPKIPKPGLLTLIIAISYLSHWFFVIPWVTIKMSIFPKNLKWVKTNHHGKS